MIFELSKILSTSLKDRIMKAYRQPMKLWPKFCRGFLAKVIFREV